MNPDATTYSLHVFCDASEQAYGLVAYLTMESEGKIHVAFVMARSRVAPRKQLSMPCLELCGALTGAQLSSLLHKELSLTIRQTCLWTDSTTVLSWLKSESCRFKVFVGTRITDIEELTQLCEWRYVDSANNPADDATRGKMLGELAVPNGWIQGPPFLRCHQEQWPKLPSVQEPEGSDEQKKSTFCGLTQTAPILEQATFGQIL